MIYYDTVHRMNNRATPEKYLLGQGSTPTSRNQLPIFCCTQCTREDILACYFERTILDDVMNQNELTTPVLGLCLI